MDPSTSPCCQHRLVRLRVRLSTTVPVCTIGLPCTLCMPFSIALQSSCTGSHVNDLLQGEVFLLKLTALTSTLGCAAAIAFRGNYTDMDYIDFATNIECLEGLFDTWGTFGRGFVGALPFQFGRDHAPHQGVSICSSLLFFPYMHVTRRDTFVTERVEDAPCSGMELCQTLKAVGYPASLKACGLLERLARILQATWS